MSIQQSEASRPGASVADDSWRDLFVTARDGLRLHARDYGPHASPWWPVVCLPGLSRNAADFHELAVHLATHRHRPRRVVAVDYRGRGLSGHDRNWRNYTPQTEAADLFDLMAAAGLPHAAFVGTSRGGLILMQIAALRPAILKAVVLNDIGPEIDRRGLLRIKNTLESMPQPANWEDAAAVLRRTYGASFPKLDADGWMNFARKSFVEHDGRLVRPYDRRLQRQLKAIDFEAPLPALWSQFDALGHVPVMVLRGRNSDLLAAETLARMIDRRPDLVVLEVDDAGHPPMLVDAGEITRISGFVTKAEDQG